MLNPDQYPANPVLKYTHHIYNLSPSPASARPPLESWPGTMVVAKPVARRLVTKPVAKHVASKIVNKPHSASRNQEFQNQTLAEEEYLNFKFSLQARTGIAFSPNHYQKIAKKNTKIDPGGPQIDPGGSK